jgi:hypothetical protein
MSDRLARVDRNADRAGNLKGRHRIVSGSLEGIEGIVVGSPAVGRVRIALVTRSGLACVEINESTVKPVEDGSQ